MSEYSFKENEYLVVGWAQGLMDTEEEDANGKKVNVQRPYYQLFVLSPVSSYKSDTYTACGLKAQKLKCASDAVWKNINPRSAISSLTKRSVSQWLFPLAKSSRWSPSPCKFQIPRKRRRVAPSGVPPPLTGGHYLQKRHGGSLYG